MATNSRPIILVGNLTTDPKLTQNRDGEDVAKFGVAVNRGHMEDDKFVEDEPEFFNVTAKEGQAAHAARSLRKGDRVVVDGRRWNPREYERDDGSTGVADHDVFGVEIGASIRFRDVAIDRTLRSVSRTTSDAGLSPAS